MDSPVGMINIRSDIPSTADSLHGGVYLPRVYCNVVFVVVILGESLGLEYAVDQKRSSRAPRHATIRRPAYISRGMIHTYHEQDIGLPD